MNNLDDVRGSWQGDDFEECLDMAIGKDVSVSGIWSDERIQRLRESGMGNETLDALEVERELTKRLATAALKAIVANHAYTREMLDPSSTPDSRCAAADEKNQAESEFDALIHDFQEAK